MRAPALACSAVVLAIALPTPAATAAPGGLLVSPTRIDATVRAGDALPPIVLSNGTDRTLVVSAAAVLAGQELSGLPRFDLSARSLRQGRRTFRVSPRRLRLAPGARARVSVIVGRPPRPRQVGVYGAVSFTTRAVQERGESGAVVAPTVRLATNLLLRYPGAVRIRGRATEIRAEQGARRTLRFLARIRNDGNLHVRARARLAVYDARDKLVLRRRFRPETVIPGAERELPLDVAKLLPAGDYRGRLKALVGRQRSRREFGFRLVGPNELPTPKLQILALETPRPDAGEEFDAVVQLANAGTGAITPEGTLTLTASGEDRPLVSRPLRPGAVAPGKRDRLTARLGGVPAGRYAMTARFASGPRVLDERTVVFETGTRLGLLERILDWMAAHIPAVLAGFAVMLLAIVAGAGAYIRRLRRTLETAG